MLTSHKSLSIGVQCIQKMTSVSMIEDKEINSVIDYKARTRKLLVLHVDRLEILLLH